MGRADDVRVREQRGRRGRRRLRAKYVKRRAGQVVAMRDGGAEAGRYAGEATGIRTTVTHSRKMR